MSPNLESADRCVILKGKWGYALAAGANAIAIQHIKLENEGWKRDVNRVA
jgi:hypothetical protein